MELAFAITSLQFEVLPHTLKPVGIKYNCSRSKSSLNFFIYFILFYFVKVFTLCNLVLNFTKTDQVWVWLLLLNLVSSKHKFHLHCIHELFRAKWKKKTSRRQQHDSFTCIYRCIFIVPVVVKCTTTIVTFILQKSNDISIHEFRSLWSWYQHFWSCLLRRIFACSIKQAHLHTYRCIT